MPRSPGYSSLRKYRYSSPAHTYFLTFCLKAGYTGLERKEIASAIYAESDCMKEDRAWSVRVSTLMPNHAHFLAVLGDRLTLSQAMGRLKGKTSGILCSSSLLWQDGYFEHRLRPDESVQPIFHYIYMNPYRAELISIEEKWPHFRCSEEDWWWFKNLLNEECPYPEWLDERAKGV